MRVSFLEGYEPLCLKRNNMFFFFNDTATTEIYTLSLHDALPISWLGCGSVAGGARGAELSGSGPARAWWWGRGGVGGWAGGSEEHTSELLSRPHLVCRLLLEKKKLRADALIHVLFSAGAHRRGEF